MDQLIHLIAELRDSLYTIVPEQYNSRIFPSSLNFFCVYIR